MNPTLVNALFVISLVLPPAVVAIGLVLLAWPRRQPVMSRAAEQAHAH
jgi:ABC-type molybdate transport system permease subunit